MRRRLLALPAMVGAISLSPPAQLGIGHLAGRVFLLDSRSNEAPAKDAVIWLPDVKRAMTPRQTPTITQRDKRFEPHVLAVPKGAAVEFPNLDRIFHNVFSVTPGSQFDLGLYRGGDSKLTRFDTPGLVRVYCNIHPQMAAYVFVVDGVAFTVTDADGRFHIEDVPAGPLTVRVWHPKGNGKEQLVEVRPSETAMLEVRLDGSGYREQPHKNKHGRDYPPLTNEADRY